MVAFEVIEHLENWREFLAEARRVLAPSGQFIVSTPNRLYYTESRGPSGANPFHVHEFDFEEFRAELAPPSPTFRCSWKTTSRALRSSPAKPAAPWRCGWMPGEAAPDESHFFVAVCAHRPQIGNPTFVYVPRAANVLRERERHIALLEGELATKNQWLEKALGEHEELMAQFTAQQQDLERSNRWAETLNRELAERGARIVELQEELAATHAAYGARIAALEQDIRAKTQWALDREAEVQKQIADLVAAVDALHHTEKELEERTAWALRLEKEARELDAQLALVRASRWVRLGRKVGLGPAWPQ